jgi:hypothetical protein
VRVLILAVAALVSLSACQKTSPPGEAPTGVTVTPGDGVAVVQWDTLPDLTYWIFYQPGSTVDVATPNSIAIRRAFSPRVVGPLANGVQYAFVMNATHNDSAAGPNSLPALATPRLAGDTWTAGTALGAPPQNLASLALAGSRFVAVGDAGTIFAGDLSYTSTNPNPEGVTAWMPPTTLPVGFTANLSSVIYNGSFIAMGTDGSIISSADGVNWVLGGPIPATGMNGIAFAFVAGNGTYVAVGNGGNIFKTTDLVNWAQATSGTTSDLNSITLLDNGNFLVAGAGGTLLTSMDGSNWTPQVSNTTSTLRAATFRTAATGVRYVAVGDAGAIVTSPDAFNWTAVMPPPAQDLRSITVGGATASRFLAVGQGGAVSYSDDGVNWIPASSGSANLAKLLFVGGMYLAVGDAGANAVSR